MNYQITYEKNPKSKDIQILNDGIMEQAKQKKGMKQLDFFAFFIRDENGKVIGILSLGDLVSFTFNLIISVTASKRKKKKTEETVITFPENSKITKDEFITLFGNAKVEAVTDGVLFTLIHSLIPD